MKAYLVTFDPQAANIADAHRAITSVPGGEWWHYLSGTYIVTSNLSLANFKQDLMSKWSGGSILIIEVKRSSDGMLPREAWDWINTRVPLS